jgi:hypothetical protein
MALIIAILILVVFRYTTENFYSSGSNIRYLSQSATAGEQDLKTNDFNNRELQYYIRRS